MLLFAVKPQPQNQQHYQSGGNYNTFLSGDRFYPFVTLYILKFQGFKGFIDRLHVNFDILVIIILHVFLHVFLCGANRLYARSVVIMIPRI